MLDGRIGFPCAISSVHYRVLDPDRVDTRPLQQALLQDYGISINRQPAQPDFTLGRAAFNKQHDTWIYDFSSTLLSLSLKKLKVRPKRLRLYMEIYRTADSRNHYSRQLKFRLLVADFKTLTPEIDLVGVRIVPYASHLRFVVVVTQESKQTAEQLRVAYVSKFYTHGMPHCGGIIPVLPAEAEKLKREGHWRD